jgi:hypothetical protein
MAVAVILKVIEIPISYSSDYKCKVSRLVGRVISIMMPRCLKKILLFKATTIVGTRAIKIRLRSPITKPNSALTILIVNYIKIRRL